MWEGSGRSLAHHAPDSERRCCCDGATYSASTVTTPDTALMAPAICGETLKRPGSFTSTSLPLPSISTIADFAVAVFGAAAAGRQLDRLEPPRHAFDRRIVAQEHAQALLHFRRRLIERLGRLDAGAHLVALHFGGEKQKHRRAGLQQIAVLRQAFREQHRLVMRRSDRTGR